MKKFPNPFSKKRKKKPVANAKGGNVVALHKASARQTQPIRIIGGQWRGSKLPVAAVNGLRPSNDRVRETVFNWLAPVIEGARCVDLFAGSGALGFEALSRQAQQVDMIELANVASLQLQKNLTALTLSEQQQGYVHNISCFDWLRQQAHSHTSSLLVYDIVFVDPPFALALMEKSLAQIAQHLPLSAQALIYVEHPSSIQSLALPTGWQVHKHKKAGQVHYGLLRTR